MTPSPRLVLASASPRRRALLTAAGLAFEPLATGADEIEEHPASPRALALHNASIKAEAAARALGETSAVIVSADTIVIFEGQVLGKPRDRADARRMLSMLGGRTHEVITAMGVRMNPSGGLLLDAESSAVTFNPLSPEFIEAYTASGESDDKAGSYGIQGMGADLIHDVRGDLTNVIGLPLRLFARGVESMTGVNPLAGLDRHAIAAKAFPDMPERLREWVL